MSGNGTKPKIGRGAIVVDDPVSKYRPRLGPTLTDELDVAATVLAPGFAGKSVAELKELRGQFVSSLSERLDQDRAARSSARDAGISASADKFRLAEEVLWVSRGRADAAQGQEQVDLEFEVAEARIERDEALAAVGADPREAEHLGASEENRDQFSTSASRDPEGSYVRSWVRDNAESLASVLAIERELRIAERQSELKRTGARKARSAPAAGVKQVGTEEAALLAQRSFVESGWAAGLGRPAGVSVSRADVDHPPLIDRSDKMLPEEHQQNLETRMAPLADWVAMRSDAFVEKRFQELSASPSASRATELQVARLNHAEEIEKYAIETARANARKHPERAAGEKKIAAEARASLESIAQEREGLKDAGGVELRVYAREREIRHRMKIEHGVRTSIEEPSQALTEIVGPKPERGTPEHDLWVDLASKVETHRLQTAAAVEQGIDPPKRNPELDKAVVEHQAGAGSKANVPVPVVEPEGMDVGV